MNTQITIREYHDKKYDVVIAEPDGTSYGNMMGIWNVNAQRAFEYICGKVRDAKSVVIEYEEVPRPPPSDESPQYPIPDSAYAP